MYPNAPGYRPQPPSQGTAETLVLVAWVIQLIVSLFTIGFGAIFLIGGAAFFFFPAAGLFLLLLGGLLVALPILMLYVGYEYCYARIKRADFAGAKGPTLLMGILGLLFGFVIVGVLYLIGYVKLSDAENEARMTPAWPGYGVPSYGYGAPMPSYGAPTGVYPGMPGGTPLAGGVAYAAPPPAVAQTCPRCGRPATFIPQYGRSYCYNCAQYL